mgnify:CR=1 FL=1
MAPIEFYFWPTPNGWKIALMLEECALPYEIEWVDLSKNEQFKEQFLKISPNGRMPAIVDPDGPGGAPISIFESGAVLQYLGDKTGQFYPADRRRRTDVEQWLFWQIGSAPFIGGGFGHFYAYAPEKFEYPINRYAMETKRLFDVADQRLGESRFLAGEDYTIADIATFAWLAPFVEGNIYSDAKTFLSIDEYANVARWVEEIAARPAVQRGRIVTKVWGDEDSQLRERHSAADFEGKVLTPSKPV